MPDLALSVVVSSYRRPQSLRRLLEALADQTLSRERYEVIVVNNGAGAETADVLTRAQSQLALNLRYVQLEQTLGPAGGRNRGWQMAEAPLVAFTDDDCRPAADWLEQLVTVADATDARNRHVIIQGATRPEPPHLERLRHTLFARIVSVSAADGRYETCNIVYPRALLEQLGGFDERFLPRGLNPRPVGEDTDLGWRARSAGVRAVFAPAAVVYHEVVRLGPLGTLIHQTRWGGAVHIFKVHPAARAILFRRLFWNVWHYMLVQVLISRLGPRWLRRLILRRYLRALRARARECGAGIWAVPYLIAHDVTEAVALITASVRERTPVL